MARRRAARGLTSGHRVLVVEDDQDLLASTMQILRREGHEVEGAATAADALASMVSFRPHLVLLDFYLRETTGETVSRQIREIDDVCQVLLVTGYASEQPARKLLADLDIQGYHDKSDGPDRLLVLVDAALKHYRALKSVDDQRRNLRQLLEVSPRICALQTVGQLLETSLTELCHLIHSDGGFIATSNSGIFVLGSAEESVSVHAATGRFAGARALSELPPAVAPVVGGAMTRDAPYAIDGSYVVVPLRTRHGDRGCMIIDAQELPRDAVEACAIYAGMVVQALENVLLYERATVDPLTRLYSRDFGLQRLDEALRLASRTEIPASVIMLDVDHFKSFNDRHGHAAGDLVLHAVGDALRATCRVTDVASRHGGEEFLIVLPATDAIGALTVAERMRQHIEELRLSFEGNLLSVTASFGVAAVDPRTRLHGGSHLELVKRADRALYRAKTTGRNRVIADNEAADAVAA